MNMPASNSRERSDFVTTDT